MLHVDTQHLRSPILVNTNQGHKVTKVTLGEAGVTDKAEMAGLINLPDKKIAGHIMTHSRVPNTLR